MKRTLALLSVILCSSSAWAGGYREKTSGDLSDRGLQPDTISLEPGRNVVSGLFGTRVKPGGQRTDRDYFSFTLAEGQTLDAIVLDPKTDVGGAYSFIAVQSGAQVTMPPDGGSPAELLGWAHFGSGDEGIDILPAIGAGSGAIGFKPPLGPGTYSFWLQELAPCRCKYTFIFTVGTSP
jgi:hypothetical protein